MKIKNGFILREFAGKWLAYSGDSFEENKNVLVTLNRTGAFVWELLQNEVLYEDVISKLIERYDVDDARARADFENFLIKCRLAGLIEE